MARLLIVGATGLVGGLAVERALGDPRVSHVIALTRRPIAAKEKLENVVVDFSALPELAAWWSVDGVVSALGTTRATAGSQTAYRTVDYEFPLAVARRTRHHGATRFAAVSSLGANPRSAFAYTRTKGELERELCNLDFPSLTIVRPSVLDGHRDEARLDERAATLLFRMLAFALPSRMRISPASTVAAALVDGAIDGPPGVHVLTNDEMRRSVPIA